MKNYKDLLNEITIETEVIKDNINSRVLIIDAMNLFFRNFSMLNMINQEGEHIGGLGGFLRSLGSLIQQINPTSVYIIFDGVGSSQNRKNIIPEYKSQRNITKITNWEIFNDLDEENDSKINQLTRLIQYLKVLPVKIMSMERVEADDVISVISKSISLNPDNKVFMVTNDRDYIQIVKDNAILYVPSNKKYYTPKDVLEEYKCLPENFIWYKILMGDNSDNIKGIRGLGPKSFNKLFSVLKDDIFTFEDLIEFCSERITEHLLYARVVQNKELLRKSTKVMDLSNPMIDKNDEELIEEMINDKELEYHPSLFKEMYVKDGIGKIISSNIDLWLKNNFESLNKFSILK